MTNQNVTSYLNNAADFVASKNYQKAKECYFAVIAEDIKNLEAWKGIGLCEYNLKNYNDALKAFNEALSVTSEDATIYFYLGAICALRGRLVESCKHYEKVIELRPDYIKAYKNLMTNYFKLKNFDKVLEIYEQLEDMNIKDSAVLSILATIKMNKKDYQGAIELFNQALELDPQKEQILNNIGVCYLSLQDPDEAIIYFKKAIEISKTNYLTYTNIGTAYQVKGEYLYAIDAFSKSLELKPDNILTLISIANIASLLKDYKRVTEAYEKVLSLNPNMKEVKLSLIAAYVKAGESPKALTLVDELLKKSPKDIPLLFRKAKIYTDICDYEMALSIYKKILSIKKNSPAIYHSLGILHTKRADFDEAIVNLNKSLTLDENNASAHKDLAIIYLMRNQVEYAKAEFEKAEELGQNSAEILKECADFNYSISNFNKAQILYKKSIDLERNPYTSLGLGICLIAQNKTAEAFHVLEPLTKIIPHSPELLYNLARIYYTEKEYEMAMSLLNRAYRIVPTIEIANLLALCQKNIGEYESAAKIFEGIISEYPYNSFVYDDLIDCYKKLNDTDKIAQVYKIQSEKLPYDERRAIEYAQFLMDNNQSDEAKKFLDKTYFEYPSEAILELKNSFKYP